MTTTHVDGLDRSIHETNTWLKEIGEELGWQDRERAYAALRSTLHTLRDRLMPEQASHLAAHLPLLLAGVFWDGYTPAGKPHKTRDPEVFTSGVRETFLTDSAVDPEEAIRGVVTVLERHVDPGEMRHVLDALPKRIRDLVGGGVRE